MRCMIYRFLYKILPVLPIQRFVMGRHLSRCPHCAGEYGVNWENGPGHIGVTADAADLHESQPVLWQQINDRIIAEETIKTKTADRRTAIGFSPRQWVLAGLAVIVVILLVPLLVRNINQRVPQTGASDPANTRVVINSVQVDHKPAETVCFQTHDKDRLIVWVKRSKEGPIGLRRKNEHLD